MKMYYTFRTNKHIDEIKALNSPVFIFGNLKKDLKEFCSILEQGNIDTIIGLAEIHGQTRIESTAINKFGKDKKVNNKGLEKYEMHILKDSKHRVSGEHTTSFCNWAMYKIAEYIKNNKLNIRHSFIHFNKADVARLS